MAFFQGVVRSKTLEMDTSISVILPNDRVDRPQGGFPVVFLLHGLSDDHSCWPRFTSIERYANERGLAIIMPEVQRSFYCDMKYGLDYFSYVSKELPLLCREMFDISPDRRDTFVAGLSMGGYGAVKCAFSNPGVFSACASLSGALDVYAFQQDDRYKEQKEFYAIGAGEMRKSDDLFYLANQVMALPEQLRPGVYLCCGKQDFLYSHSISLKNHLNEIGMPFVFVENNGDHNWEYWDLNIPDALDFFIQYREQKFH